MAINKNFVIKNGIQVNDTLLVGDSTNNKVGINTTTPDYELHVIGGIGVTDAKITGVTTALGDVLVANSNGEDGKAFAVRVSAGNSVGINSANPRYPLEVIGPVSLGQTAQYIFGDLDVSGDIFSANFNSGNAQFSGITTFTDATPNVLGDANTGSVQLDGGLGVEGNVTVGSGLSVFGNSFFVGIVTFAAGASGTIQLGDNADDSVEFEADVNSNIIPNGTTPAFDLGSSSQEWRDLHLAGNAGIGSLSVSGISTFGDTVEITSLTDNRIAIVGAGSTIEDDANLTFDGETLAVGAGVTFDSNDTTESTSSTTGSAQFAGGVGIEKQLYVGAGASVGTGLTVGGVFDSNDTTESTSSTTGSAKFAGGVGIEKQLYVGAGASVGAGLTVAGDLLPEANGTRDLGSSSVEWKDLYIDGTANIDTLSADTATIGDLTDNRVVIAGSSGELEDDANLTFDGTTLSVGAALTVTGITTFTNSTDNTLGDTGTGAVKIAGGLAVAKNITASGITTFTDATDNTLGDTGTGAVRIAGGLAVAKNVTVGSGLSVTGTSYFVGEVTFAGGATGNDINLGSTNEDNVVFVADVKSHIIPNDDDTYDLGSSSNQWKDLYVNGLAELDFVNVSAASTFGSDLDINADVDISGNAGIGSLVVTGISTFVGLSTFNDGLVVHSGISTLHTLNIGIDGQALVGITTILDEDTMVSDRDNALATQQSIKAYVDAQVTAQDLDFQADTGGAHSVDLDSETLHVVGTTYEIETSGSSSGIGNTITIGLPNDVIVGSALTVTDRFAVGTAITAFSGIITATSLDISDNAGIGSISVAGVSTFVGLSTFNDGIIVHSGISTFKGRIVGAAVSNVIPFLYNNFTDLPSASTYHGAFAHVHQTGKAYYAHANAWYELVNKDLTGVVGTGTEGYNVGVITATSFDGLGQIGVGSEGTFIGVGITMVDFKSTNTSNTVDVDGTSGIATVTVTTGVSLGLAIALGG